MKARVSVHRDFTIGAIDDRIYSAFLEHLGRAVYGGIYEPGHQTADEDGFRGDVLDLVRDLNAAARPLSRRQLRLQLRLGGRHRAEGQAPGAARLRLAARPRPTQVGTDEFVRWCRKAGTAPMLAVNLGSQGLRRGPRHARILQPSRRHATGATSAARTARKEPHNVKVWCLGNEMDGPWQMNHRTAYEYGRIANEVGRGMKTFDPTLELVACGSSHANMPTYPDWEAEVLDRVLRRRRLHLAAHLLGQLRQRLPELPRQVGAARPLHPHGRRHHRLREGEEALEARRLHLLRRVERLVPQPQAGRAATATAWNWPEAPPLLEDVYNFEDVLLVGCALNTFIRRADRVKVACIAQLVNVIAPIMTENGGPAWKQTTYYPLYYASLYGRGEALERRRRRADLRRQGRRRRALSRRRRGQERRRQDADLLHRQPPPGRGDEPRHRPGRLRAEGARRARHDRPSRPHARPTPPGSRTASRRPRARASRSAMARSRASLPPRSYHVHPRRGLSRSAGPAEAVIAFIS